MVYEIITQDSLPREAKPTTLTRTRKAAAALRNALGALATRTEAPVADAALLSVVREARRLLTDTAQVFAEYVGSDGIASTTADVVDATGRRVPLAYVRFTASLNAAFGLTEAQRRARKSGKNLRELIDADVLFALARAERAAARRIRAMMESSHPRAEIRAAVSDLFQHHAQQCYADLT